MKDSLNSMVLYNFQKFHTRDFIESHDDPFFPLPLYSPPPRVTLVCGCVL